jgi:hypothetical protein
MENFSKSFKGNYRLKEVIYDNHTKETLLSEHVFDGFHTAMITSRYCSYTTYRCLEEKTYIKLLIDISKYRNCISHCFYKNLIPKDCYSIFLERLCKNVNISIGNLSPSKWDNGYGRCDYAEATLYTFNGECEDSKTMMTNFIKTGINSETIVDEIGNISEQLITGMRPLFKIYDSCGEKLLTPDWSF